MVLISVLRLFPYLFLSIWLYKYHAHILVGIGRLGPEFFFGGSWCRDSLGAEDVGTTPYLRRAITSFDDRCLQSMSTTASRGSPLSRHLRHAKKILQDLVSEECVWNDKICCTR